MKNPRFCPCHSGFNYESCCKPFHKGKVPNTALKLMRSRYSAYALHLVEYIINTTHANLHEPLPYWRESISFFCSHTFFKNLEILEEECGFPFSTVTFKATLLQEGQIVILTEKSTFISIENNWLYYKMDIL